MSKEHRMKIEGHRGYRLLQNSAKGFKKSIELGLDGIETDLWVLKDKTVIILHQSTPDGLISLKCPKTNEICLKYIKETEYSDLKGKVDLHTGEEIITLDELFNIFAEAPQMYLNLEIKENNRENFEIVAQVLERRKPVNKILMSSFEHQVKDYLDKFKENYKVLQNVAFGYLIFRMNEFEKVREKKSTHFLEKIYTYRYEKSLIWLLELIKKYIL